MRLLLAALVTAILAGVAAYQLTIRVLPGRIMDRAMAAMEERGIPLHGFALAPRMTPDRQTVVRPSPDLAYSVCRFDLSGDVNAIRVTAAPWQPYASVSFFDARTNNFATVRAEEGADVILSRHPSSDAGIIEAPTVRGLVLIRRLAPTPDDYVRVASDAAPGDTCAPVD